MVVCSLADEIGPDGGAMRAISQIVVLYEISNRIMHDRELRESPRLCDYFDMIAGVGPGG
jgi:hypothetical protein